MVAEAKDLYEDIDKCIGDLVLARSKHNQRGISDAHWKMETLMVNTQQVLSYILDTIEAKEVDFGAEVYKYIDEHFNVYDDGNRTLQTKDKKSLIGSVDVENIAKHFFELGINAQESKN